MFDECPTWYNVVSNEEDVPVTDKPKAPSTEKSGGPLSMLKTALSGVSGLFVDTVEVPDHAGGAPSTAVARRIVASTSRWVSRSSAW